MGIYFLRQFSIVLMTALTFLLLAAFCEPAGKILHRKKTKECEC